MGRRPSPALGADGWSPSVRGGAEGEADERGLYDVAGADETPGGPLGRLS